ncbi:MAG: hypothetical protein ABJN12_09745 [Shimia thalassica]|uniref:hypothetical protein n=1 Tax=Shimia thalassica TaxID=1715693 RepID=UPI00329A3F6E
MAGINRRSFDLSDTHPITGAKLNPLKIERVRLNFDAAVTAWIMRLQGEKIQIIAQRLGTNTYRLGEVYREEVHPSSKQRAIDLLIS